MAEKHTPPVEMVAGVDLLSDLYVILDHPVYFTAVRIRMDVGSYGAGGFHFRKNNNNLGGEMKTIRVICGKSIVMYGVVSSNIMSVGYDHKDMQLYVEFLDGSLYRYYDVTPDIWSMFMLAKSKGSFLHFYIKINDYDYEDVTGSVSVEDGGSIASIGGDPGTEHPDGYIVMK